MRRAVGRSIGIPALRVGVVASLLLTTLCATALAVEDPTPPVIRSVVDLAWRTPPLLGDINDHAPNLQVLAEDPESGVDSARTEITIDGEPYVGFSPLTEGPHTARVIVFNNASLQTTGLYPFNVVCPELKLRLAGAYWENRSARILRVNWKFTNTGSGSVWETRVFFNPKSGASYLGPVDPTQERTFFTNLAPGASKTVTTRFQVPVRVRTLRIGQSGSGALDDAQHAHPVVGKRGTSPVWKLRVPR